LLSSSSRRHSSDSHISHDHNSHISDDRNSHNSEVQQQQPGEEEKQSGNIQESHKCNSINRHQSHSSQDPDRSSITGVSNEVHHPNDGHQNHSHISHGFFQHSALRSVLLLLALSFHSVFEGIAIGLQETKDSLISLFIAVIVHKAVMGFSLGLNIAQSELSVRSFIISILVFSLASPLGIGIGMGVANLPDTLPTDIANGVLQGIAGGTFLYITFFEVLPHELNVPSKRLWKVFFVIIGYAAICVLLLVS